MVSSIFLKIKEQNEKDYQEIVGNIENQLKKKLGDFKSIIELIDETVEDQLK